MRNKFKKLLLFISEKLLPPIFFLLIIFGFDSFYIGVITLIAALLHELGHICALLYFRREVGLSSVLLHGMRLRHSASSPYREKIIILLCGPAFNLILSLPLLLPVGDYLHTFAIINFTTALANLIPVESYDGYEALCALFELREWRRLQFALPILSYAFSALMCFASLYFIGRVGGGYWIFAVFFSLLLSRTAKYHSNGIF